MILSRLRKSPFPSLFEGLVQKEEKTKFPQNLTILIPKPWPDFETIIQVPTKVNYLVPINEHDYKAGITFQGHYPYNENCSSIWLLRKINDKYVPIRDLLNS